MLSQERGAQPNFSECTQRNVPNPGKPNPQFGSGLVEDGAGRDGRLEFAMAAYEATTGRSTGLTRSLSDFPFWM